MAHLGDHAVALLDIVHAPFERKKHHFGIEAVDQKIRRVGHQPMVMGDVDIRCGGTQFAHR
jgi:hypothetical protein